MKKIVFVLAASFGLMAANASPVKAAPAPFVKLIRIANNADYVGKFKYEGLPFEHMEVSIREEKLYFAGGEYSGLLTPLDGKPDVFDANGQAVFTFLRNTEKKVTELQIDYQGQTFVGRKE